MTEIVFLDAYSLNPGDIDFRALEELGSLSVYDRTEAAQVAERCRDAEIVIVNKFRVDHSNLPLMPSVKYIVVAATGYNNIDPDAVKSAGIPVSNVRAYGTDSVAQYVLASMLAFYNRTDHYVREVKAGRWQQSPDFCFYDHSVRDLSGKMLGIIGYGAIGSRVAQLGLAFGMEVLSYTRTPPETVPAGCRLVGMEELLRQSDVISLHCPLTAETDRLINTTTLDLMKNNVLLINTGRGGLVDENDLYDALSSGRIAGAILDVLTTEPPAAHIKLTELENCLITPHIAWASVESRQKLADGIAANIKAYLHGQWTNRVY